MQLLVPTLLYLWLGGLAWLGTTAEYSLAGIVVFVGLYGLLVALVHGLALAGARVSHVLAWVGSIPAGWFAVGQLEEQLLIPESLRTAGWAVLLVALAYGELVWRLGDSGETLSRSPRRPLLVSLTAGLVLTASCGLLLRSELLRWHLLRHHTVLGTPTFHLYEEPVAEVWARVFLDHDAQPLPKTQDVPAEAFGETLQLYDLEADPGETRNLVEERPEIVTRLFESLDEPVERWSLAEPYRVTSANLEQLRALGYVD